MKLTFAVTLLLSILSCALAQDVTTQLPSGDAVPPVLTQPVRTQPLGELLTPDSPKQATVEHGFPAMGNVPAGLKSRINNPQPGAPARLAHGITVREIDTKNAITLPTTPPAKSPAISPGAASVKLLAKPAVTPPALIAAAMENRDAENRLTGRGMTLVEALSFANSPQRQLEVIHAYWHLVSSVASYNLECQLLRRLEGLRGSATAQSAMQTALASAAASREEARCLALTAQHSLAEASMLDVGDSLPLPVDIPHVGAYRTRFAELFSARPAPPRLRLIDRALPIHCKAIDARARAIATAEKSLRVATADYDAGREDLEAVVSRIAQLNRQHLALVNSVCNYNHEIVEYAVTSLAQPISGPTLVSMLIETKHGGATHYDPRTLPASATRPLGSRLPSGRLPSQSPTLAPTRTGGHKNNEPWAPTPAAADNSIRPPQRLEPAGREPIRPVVPVHAPNQPLDLPQPQDHWTPPARTTHKPVAASGLYPALVSASPSDRAKHLVETLHWDRNLPADAGRAIGLADYLGLGHGINRQALVEAFWLSRQRVAEFQVLDQQSQLLNEIQVTHSVRLEAARLAAKADTIDAHIRLLESQFRLTNLVGKTPEPTWLTAQGVPRFAFYDVAAFQAGSDTWELRSRRALIPAIHTTLCSHAVAVVEADSARADAIAKADSSLDITLQRTFQQTEETLALLASVTAYNNSIASYVLRVLPAGVSSQVLAEKLLAGS